MALEDWLRAADLVTGVVWYKIFLAAYYCFAVVIARRLWRRRVMPDPTLARRAWALLWISLATAPTLVGIGAAVLMPFPLGMLMIAALAWDGYALAGIMLLAASVTALAITWLILIGVLLGGRSVRQLRAPRT